MMNSSLLFDTHNLTIVSGDDDMDINRKYHLHIIVPILWSLIIIFGILGSSCFRAILNKFTKVFIITLTWFKYAVKTAFQAKLLNNLIWSRFKKNLLLPYHEMYINFYKCITKFWVVILRGNLFRFWHNLSDIHFLLDFDEHLGIAWCIIKTFLRSKNVSLFIRKRAHHLHHTEKTSV